MLIRWITRIAIVLLDYADSYLIGTCYSHCYEIKQDISAYTTPPIRNIVAVSVHSCHDAEAIAL